jgi:hypothetical protein
VEVIRVETVYHIYPSKLNYDPNIWINCF